MAALSAAKRLARLGWWVGLSTGAMLAAACGAMFTSACKSSSPPRLDASADALAAIKQDSPGIVLPGFDASTVDGGAPIDASETDLWNTPCE
jgi:hypothetical protein